MDASRCNDRTIEYFIIMPSETIVKGKNNYLWSTELCSARKASSRAPAMNIIHIVPG